MQIINNKLYIGGISSEDLISKFKSPLYVYEEDVIRQRFRDLKDNMAYPNLRLYYACKANTNIAIMKILREEGAFIDAVSPGEMFLALEAGYDKKQIMFTGNNSTDEDMKFAIKHGILVNADSLSQLERYGRLNPNSKVCVRINPNVGAGHHGHVITGGPDSKFGVYYDKVNEIKNIARKYDLKIIGVHQHIGSGILETGKFLEAMKVLLMTARHFDDLEFVDFGGGIGVPYRPNEKPIDMKIFGAQVSQLFSDFCTEYGKELTLALEPGRYFVCEAGILLATANTIKETTKHKFIGVDTGFNHLIRVMAYGSYHPIIVANNAESKDKEGVIICGNICESGDVFTKNEEGLVERELPAIKEGDIIAILNSGAYGYSMSSNYNSRPKPAEILVKDGKARIIRDRELLKDLLKGQVLQ